MSGHETSYPLLREAISRNGHGYQNPWSVKFISREMFQHDQSANVLSLKNLALYGSIEQFQ